MIKWKILTVKLELQLRHLANIITLNTCTFTYVLEPESLFQIRGIEHALVLLLTYHGKMMMSNGHLMK